MFSLVYHPEVIKKSQKTPAKEIDLAKKRLAEVLNETGSHKELHNAWELHLR